MKKIAVIGAGISGLSIARILQNGGCQVKVFESEASPGGLVRCSEEKNRVLYHRVGGHVFNSRREDVLEWFWSLFDRESEFVSSPRHAKIYFEADCWVGYPIENHLRDLPSNIRQQVIAELLELHRQDGNTAANLRDFFNNRFGKTLNEIYFTPYNDKIWQMDCERIPLTWLEGKLPTPSLHDIIMSNINHEPESTMVHSSFFYPKRGGSQFIAQRLAQGLSIAYGCKISSINRQKEKWMINDEYFDAVVYTGNIKELPALLDGVCDFDSVIQSDISQLESHGTCSVLCRLDPNSYSWVYLPHPAIKAHRIICTGNFSSLNNGIEQMTGTVEFSCPMGKEEILEQLKTLPFHPQYISHHWEPCTYPIAGKHGRELISNVKRRLEEDQFYLLGRFAEWEYYNMDAAIGAALDLHTRLS